MNYYCLFHTSGFRTYRIHGEENEALSEEKKVTIECDQEYPHKADAYMNKLGARFLFQYIDSNTITLVVNEIDSIKHDTAGNAIKCAFQVIANVDESENVGKLASRIKNDLESFNVFYGDLFSMRGGLHIEGDKLLGYIDDAINSDVEAIIPEPPSHQSEPTAVPEVKKKSLKDQVLDIGHSRTNSVLAVVAIIALLVFLLKKGRELLP